MPNFIDLIFFLKTRKVNFAGNKRIFYKTYTAQLVHITQTEAVKLYFLLSLRGTLLINRNVTAENITAKHSSTTET